MSSANGQELRRGNSIVKYLGCYSHAKSHSSLFSGDWNNCVYSALRSGSTGSGWNKFFKDVNAFE
jgi:hypothetical protein